MVVTNQGSPFICSMWKVAANGGATGDMAGGGLAGIHPSQLSARSILHLV